MKIIAPLLVLSLCAIGNSSAAADEGGEAIQAMGRLNGIALACQQPALVSRARNAVITTAPKTRGNGEVFETATNAAFLEQGKSGNCPDAASLSKEIATVEKRLQESFAAPR